MKADGKTNSIGKDLLSLRHHDISCQTVAEYSHDFLWRTITYTANRVDSQIKAAAAVFLTSS